MSDFTTGWGTSMQDLTNDTFDRNTFMPDLDDDTFDWSNFVNFDAPAGSQPSLRAAYDAQGGSELDIGKPQLHDPQAFGYLREAGLNGSTALHHDYRCPAWMHSDERSFADHAAALDECTNEASYQISGTNLLATKRDLVPGQDAGLLDLEVTRIAIPATGADVSAVPQPAAQNNGDPESSSESQNQLDARNTDAGLVSDKHCMCMVCLGVGERSELYRLRGREDCDWSCRVAGCKILTKQIFRRQRYGNHVDGLIDHEESHFGYKGHFRCIEADCSYSTKRWTDLKRHYTSKHCMSPKTKFPCPELSCKYSGEHGFLRKDKMQSHYRTVHGGNVGPGKRNQAIAPKIGGAA